ncbi:aminodeoxychorismate lyase [Bacillus sp. 03113]|uniref:aminodeoxychorismate lyase n=1 Tax=Bacillus sp. 03113 TaxID=2578211 RepID=UPI00114310EA|nr:aminodeoxychorismate lyase [Bacillus sp. 03113]
MYIYLNGEFVEQEKALISPFDHGFLYGLGLFETFRIYEGHPFLLDDHLKRLNHGLKALQFEAAYERLQIFSLLQELLKKNQLLNAYIRLNVSAGAGEVGLQATGYEYPFLIIFSKSLPQAGEMQEKMAKLLKITRNTPEGNERLKSHHFLNNILAKKELGPSPNYEGLFLTKEGFLAEGITSNLFWVKEGTLYTPAIETGILNGITRQFILKMAKKVGFEVAEGFYQKEPLYEAEEVFVTNSIQEIVPFKEVDMHQFPGKEGKVVQALHKEFRKHRSVLWTRNDI